MNPISSELIEEVNKKTINKPLIYFSRDAERALGLEKVLNNYYIVCVEDSYIVEQLDMLGRNKVFCAEREGALLPSKSTLDLVTNEKLKGWVKQIAPNGFYAQLFQFNQPTVRALEALGGEVLNNSAILNRMFEDKLSQLKFFQQNKVIIPKSNIVDTKSITYFDITKEFGEDFVVQLDRAHTGLGTFFIKNEQDYNQFFKKFGGNIVKVSKFINGDTYTINSCITKKGIFISGIQYQITGYSELAVGEGATVGNDWSYAKNLSDETLKTVESEVKKIASGLQRNNYRGLFGVDFIVSNDNVYVIEINARQTANLALQTKLELNQGKIPLMLLHLCEFLNIDIANSDTQMQLLEGSQIFLRSKTDNFEVKHKIPSGIYRLQSDNSAIDWSSENLSTKQKVIFLDEDKDKPLIWQKNGYSIDEIQEGGFVLNVQRPGSKNKNEELARMQFQYQIINAGKVAPWIIEAMKAIKDMI